MKVYIRVYYLSSGRMSFRKDSPLHGGYCLKKNDLTKEILYYIERFEDMIKTSFGPMGNSKVLYDKESGKYLVTNDGAEIFSELLSFHPAITIVAEAGIATKNESGDGSIITALLCCELVKKAANLVKEGLHPIDIVEGYYEALRISLETIEKYSRPINCSDENSILALARSVISAKLDSVSSNHIAGLIIKLLAHHLQPVKDYNQLSDFLIIRGRSGGSISDSSLFNGVLLHKSGVDLLMPKIIKNAKIAILSNELGFKRPPSNVNVIIKDNDGIISFYKTRNDLLYGMARELIDVGANVVLCTGNIAEELRRFLVLNNILAIRNVSLTDVKVLAKATGATVVSNVKDLEPSHLGVCGSVKELIISAIDRWTLFENCLDPRYHSLLIRGSSESIVDSVKMSVQNCIKVIIKAVNSGGYVYGGGSIEMRLVMHLRKAAHGYTGKRQLALLSYADALEDSIITLGVNCGIDPVFAKTQLRSAHYRGEMAGIDAFTRKITNMDGSDTIDAAHVKVQYLKSATEAAITLIRTDFGYFEERIKPKPKDVVPTPVRLVREATNSALMNFYPKNN
ncbi:MAG: TCP-1/cpn60 chaperonin family protein [Crenarchaeota archaeon]|nr:TCP-1/cpn60 chaperonin family protein [Thermoproteota archaeon]